MNIAKQVIAPYVKECKLPDLDTSIRVADAALEYYLRMKREYPKVCNPGSCVGLAIYKERLISEERLSQIARMSGLDTNGIVSKISETRQLLNVKFELSFEEIALESNLPIRYAITAEKIFNDIKSEFPKDQTLSRPGILSAIMLLVAVKRGSNKKEILEKLFKITSTDQRIILSNETMIRGIIGNRYGKSRGGAPKNQIEPKMIDTEIKKELEEDIALIHNQVHKKQKQLKLQFDVISKTPK